MSQKQSILRHLQTRGQITPIEALLEYGCMRLGARVLELRQAGYRIVTIIPSDGKRYAIYTMERAA